MKLTLILCLMMLIGTAEATYNGSAGSAGVNITSAPSEIPENLYNSWNNLDVSLLCNYALVGALIMAGLIALFIMLKAAGVIG